MPTGLSFPLTLETSWQTAQSQQFWAQDPERQIHTKLLVGRPDGHTWEDLTDYLVRAEVELGDVSGVGTGGTGADAVVRQMRFVLQPEGMLIPAWPEDTAQDEDYVVGDESDVVGDELDSAALFIDRLFGTTHRYARDSFSPRDENSAWNQWNGEFEPIVKPMREVALLAAVTPPGEQPTSLDWVALFHGFIDRTSTAGSDVTVECRDLAKRLQYTYIYEPEEFGDDDNPVPAHIVIQQILDRYVTSYTPQLYVPKVPSFTCGRFRVQYGSVWDAIQKVAAQFGWFLGYRWVPPLSAFRLVLMEPPRLKDQNSVDFVLTHVKNIYDHTDEIGDEHIGNVAVIEFTEKATGERKTVIVRNEESIAEWEERAMQFSEGDLSLIDSEEEAIALGTAAVHDCGDIVGAKRVIAPFLPTADVFMGVLINDPRISSTEDFMGVVSVRHVLDFASSVFETELVGQSRVIGGSKRWRKMLTRPGASQPVRTGDMEPESVDPHRLQGPLTPDRTSVSINKSKNAVVILDDTGSERVALGNIQGFKWGKNDLAPNTYGAWGDGAGLYFRGYARVLQFGHANDEDEIDLSAYPNLANPQVIVAPKEMLTYSPGQPSAVPNIYTEAVQIADGVFKIKAKTIIKGAFEELSGSGNVVEGIWQRPTEAGPDGKKGVQTNFFRCRVNWFASGGFFITLHQEITNQFDGNGDPINWQRIRTFQHQGPVFGSHQGELNWDTSVANGVWAIRVIIDGHQAPLVTYAQANVFDAGYRTDTYLDIDGNIVDPDESSGMSVIYFAYDEG